MRELIYKVDIFYLRGDPPGKVILILSVLHWQSFPQNSTNKIITINPALAYYQEQIISNQKNYVKNLPLLYVLMLNCSALSQALISFLRYSNQFIIKEYEESGKNLTQVFFILNNNELIKIISN